MEKQFNSGDLVVIKSEEDIYQFANEIWVDEEDDNKVYAKEIIMDLNEHEPLRIETVTRVMVRGHELYEVQFDGFHDYGYRIFENILLPYYSEQSNNNQDVPCVFGSMTYDK